MHNYDSGEHGDQLRPKAARLADDLVGQFGRAAAAGRTDVLGAEGVLALQRSAGNAGVTAMLEEERSPVHDVINSGGRPLEPDVKEDMEARLGHDFSDVRVHDDSAAQASATAVNAHAYTVGSNVVFQRDRYDPTSQEGRTTLAHELSHVVQQRSGPVDGTESAGGIKVSDPSDRFEQEAAANAERVMTTPTPAPTVAGGSGPAVQRWAESQGHDLGPDQVQRQEAVGTPEEEDPAAVQGLFVQREEEEADDSGDQTP